MTRSGERDLEAMQGEDVALVGAHEGAVQLIGTQEVE